LFTAPDSRVDEDETKGYKIEWRELGKKEIILTSSLNRALSGSTFNRTPSDSNSNSFGFSSDEEEDKPKRLDVVIKPVSEVQRDIFILGY
jgi:hypothetical protein